MNQFWKYETELEPESGFHLWGPAHLFWLIFLGLAIFLIIRAARKSSPHIRHIIRRASAATALLLQVIPAAVIMAKGKYGLPTLPLHICSLASYAVFVHMLSQGRSKILSEILFFPMLPGAVLALLFPDWTMYPPLSFFSSTGFLVHGAIALYILLCLDEGIIYPDIRRAYIPLLFLVFYAAAVMPFDLAFSVNYGFLNAASPGSPLVWMSQTFGPGSGYYMSFTAAVILAMLASYGAWHAWLRRK